MPSPLAAAAADVVAFFPFVVFTLLPYWTEQWPTFVLELQGSAAVAVLTTPLEDISDTAPTDQSEEETPDCHWSMKPSLIDIPVRQETAWSTPSHTSSPSVRRSLSAPLFHELHHLDDVCMYPRVVSFCSVERQLSRV